MRTSHALPASDCVAEFGGPVSYPPLGSSPLGDNFALCAPSLLEPMFYTMKTMTSRKHKKCTKTRFRIFIVFLEASSSAYIP